MTDTTGRALLRRVKGQDRSVAVLEGLDPLPSGLVFSGKSGVGKRTLAMTFAKTLLMEGRDLPEYVLDARIDAGTETDLVVIEPDRSKKVPTVTVGQIRDLLRETQTPPLNAAKKVFVLLDVGRMTATASNALLKAVEDADPRHLFLFTVESPGLLLPTLAKRLYHVPLLPLSPESLRAIWGGEETPELVQYSRISQGSMKILTEYMRGDRKQKRAGILTLLASLATIEIPTLFKMLDHYEQQDMLFALELVHEFISDMILYQVGQEEKALHIDQEEFLRREAARIPPAMLQACSVRVRHVLDRRDAPLQWKHQLRSTLLALHLAWRDQ